MNFEHIVKGNVLNIPFKYEVDDCTKDIIIGKNGKGKTTLLRILSGGIFPDEGCVVMNDYKYEFPINITRKIKYRQDFSDRIIYVENHNCLFTNLLCEQVIEYYMSLGNYDRTIFADILGKFELEETCMKQRAFELSLGTKQKIILALVFSNSKKIIMLDEPTLGLDMYSKEVFIELLKNEKKGIIISSNDTSIFNGFNYYLLCESEEVKLLDDSPYN